MVRLTDCLDMAIAVKPQTVMLKVSYWDQSMSGINNLLEMTTQTTGPILIKPHSQNVPYETLYRSN